MRKSAACEPSEPKSLLSGSESMYSAASMVPCGNSRPCSCACALQHGQPDVSGCDQAAPIFGASEVTAVTYADEAEKREREARGRDKYFQSGSWGYECEGGEDKFKSAERAACNMSAYIRLQHHSELSRLMQHVARSHAFTMRQQRERERVSERNGGQHAAAAMRW